LRTNHFLIYNFKIITYRSNRIIKRSIFKSTFSYFLNCEAKIINFAILANLNYFFFFNRLSSRMWAWNREFKFYFFSLLSLVICPFFLSLTSTSIQNFRVSFLNCVGLLDITLKYKLFLVHLVNVFDWISANKAANFRLIWLRKILKIVVKKLIRKDYWLNNN